MRVRIAEDIGRLIRQRRSDLGWTQQALAQRVGASRLWLLKVEQGKASAEVGLILKTFHALGLMIFIEEEEPQATRPPESDLGRLIDSNRDDAA